MSACLHISLYFLVASLLMGFSDLTKQRFAFSDVKNAPPALDLFVTISAHCQHLTDGMALVVDP
jgi:hypothetical protein